MSDLRSILAVLQYGDSFFPSGAVSFSWGLEDLADRGALATSEDVQSFVTGQLRARWANFDRVVVASAHRASADLTEVAAIDERVEIHTSAEEVRSGSQRAGHALLSSCARLDVPGAASYRAMVTRGEALGHNAAMQGMLWARAGLSETDAIALSAHTFCVGLAGAGIRLGRLTHIDAQRILTVAREEAARIGDRPMPPIEQISSFAIEAEIAVIRHASRDIRLFAN